MVRLGKKGIPRLKDIVRALVGVRELDGYGGCIHVQLDDFELYLSAEKAESLAAQLTAKVRKLRDMEEQDRFDEKRKAEEAKKQHSLPYTTES